MRLRWPFSVAHSHNCIPCAARAFHFLGCTRAQQRRVRARSHSICFRRYRRTPPPLLERSLNAGPRRRRTTVVEPGAARRRPIPRLAAEDPLRLEDQRRFRRRQGPRECAHEKGCLPATTAVAALDALPPPPPLAQVIPARVPYLASWSASKSMQGALSDIKTLIYRSPRSQPAETATF